MNKEIGLIAAIELIRLRTDLAGKQKRHRIRKLRKELNRHRGGIERAKIRGDLKIL